jgi:gliding motility-associated-like protein
MSRDGSFAVSINSKTEFIFPLDYHSASYIYTYDFNKETGKFYNQQCIYKSIPEKVYRYSDYYPGVRDTNSTFSPVNILIDAAFSSNDSIFYVSAERLYDPGQPYSDTIFQFRRFDKNILESMHAYEIKSSDYYYSGPFPYGFGFPLFTAPNGKIYFIHENNNLKGAYYGEIWKIDSFLNIKIYEHKISLAQETLQYLSYPYYHHPGFVRAHFKKTCHGYEFKNVSDSIFQHFTWYFGDGDTLISDSKAHFNHIYSHSGKFFFRLRGIDHNGYTAWYSDSIEVDGSVSASARLVSSATACQWQKVQLHDSICCQVSKNPNDSVFRWDFGDGTFSTQHNPAHIYTNPGKYQAALLVNNGEDSFRLAIKDSIIILPSPKPKLEVSAETGCAPFTVQVWDRSIPSASRIITDGQGGKDSLPITEFTYSKPGTYTIHLYEKSAQCTTEDSVKIKVNEGVSTPTDIRYVSVLDEHATGIYWHGRRGISYMLYRSADGSKGQQIAVTNDSFYYDTNVNTGQYSYTYRIIAADSCHEQSIAGKAVSSILLKGNAFPPPDTSAALSWNDYSGEYSSFTIYSGKDSIGNGINTYFRDDNYLSRSTGESCYKIAAVDNKSGFRSWSNEFCIPYSPRIGIPNVFTPNKDSVNELFTIKCLGVKEYHLIIYNSWGEKIFESYNPENSWDGNFKGINCPVGLYIYILKVKGFDKTPQFYKGNITLVR